MRFSKLLVVENGKAITTELKEDDKDLQALITQIEAQDEEEEDAFQIPSLTPYVSPWNGMAKIPKDLDAAKSTLQTPFLPDEIRFDGLPLGRVPSIKFKDWDLVDSKKFPQLSEDQLRPRKWLFCVEKAGLFNLRWIPHYHHAATTIFVIRQLLCLLHDGYLWFE